MNKKDICIYWQEFTKELITTLVNPNVNNFLQWNFIHKTMFSAGSPLFLESLKQSKYWGEWEKSLRENKFGNPDKYSLYPESSSNLIHHAYSLLQIANFSSNFNIKSFNRIFEFGGGYGSYCRLLRNLGFSGIYYIYDLLPYSFLQYIYLNKVLGTVDNIQFLHDLDNNIEVDLFIALWSINEVPEELRKSILSKVKSKLYLISFYKYPEYFDELMANNKNYNWKIYKIDQLPENYYLLGERKDERMG